MRLKYIIIVLFSLCLMILLSFLVFSESGESANVIIPKIESEVKFGQSFNEVRDLLKENGVSVELSPVSGEGIGSPEVPTGVLTAAEIKKLEEGNTVEYEIDLPEESVLTGKQVYFVVEMRGSLGFALYFDKEKRLVGYEKSLYLSKGDEDLTILEVQEKRSKQVLSYPH